MKCEKCGCEADYYVIAEMSWYLMKDGQTLLIEGVSPARKKRTLCLDCFGRCAEVFANDSH